jgi:exonuclease SbcD
MQNISFIHTADLHLGAPIKGWKWNKEDVWRRQEEHLQTFERIVDVVEEHNVPFLLIAGDFLEHEYVTTSLFAFVCEQLERIADTHVLISPGNHDPYRSDSIYQRENWPDHVHIFTDQWETLMFPGYELQISGRGFADFSEQESTLPHPFSAATHHIYLMHGDYREESSPYFPIVEKSLLSHPVDYVALGHIHKRQTYRLANSRSTIVHYPGSPEAHSWKELGTRYITHGVIDEYGVHLEDIPIQTKRYERLEFELTGESSVSSLRLQLEEALQGRANDYVHVRFVGRCAFSQERDWLQSLKRQIDHPWLFYEDETQPDYDFAELRDRRTLTGTFIQLIEERLANTDDPKQKKILQEALYLGLEAMEQSRDQTLGQQQLLSS